MSLVDAVDGNRLVWLLRGRVTESVARAIEAHADGDRVAEAAQLVLRVADRHPVHLEQVVRDAAGDRLDRGQAVSVARWLPRAAETTLQVLPIIRDRPAVPDVVQAAAVASAPPKRDGVTLVLAHEVDLLGLPLLDLAADVGRLHARGRLIVGTDWIDGALGHYDGERGSIVLNLEALDGWGAVVSCWAHELGHALDPEGSEDPAERERFANALGPLLIEYEPGSVAAAGPLVERVRRRPAAILGDLPSPGPFSVFAFFRLLGERFA